MRGRAAAAGAVERFCKGIVDAVAPYAVAVKPQVAFFEALGGDGWLALEVVSRYASEAGLLVIADAKRGDIGSTARAYAAAFLEPRGAEPPLADALTVNPYLGTDSRRSVPRRLPAPRRGHLLPRPHVERRRRATSRRRCSPTALRSGVTSRGSSREWGADLVGERGMSSVGAVVGATVPRLIGDARRAMPQADHPAAGRRRSGSDARGRRARIHERPGERARQRVALGDLRLPRHRGRLAGGRGSRGGAPRGRDLGRRGLVAVVYIPTRCVACFLAVVGSARRCCAASAAAAPPPVAAPAYVVRGGPEQVIVAARAPDAQRAPASITKLMTVLVALEHARLDDVVTSRPRRPRSASRRSGCAPASS